MMFRPPPTPPYLPLYSPEEGAKHQAVYETDLLAYQRELTFSMTMESLIVLAGAAGVIIAALWAPQIILDGILLVAK